MNTKFKDLSVLFIGDISEGSTSRQRAQALERIGARVTHVDPAQALGSGLSRWSNAFHYRSGYRFLQAAVERWITQTLSRTGRFDVAWIDSGSLIGPRAVQALRKGCGSLVLYNLDDPTGPRDGQRFATLRKSIPHFDICAVVRPENVVEYRQRGAPSVVHVWRGYDELAHAAPSEGEPIDPSFKSEVAFVGTLIPGERRDEFLWGLVQQGVPLAIWGNRWERSGLWSRLKPYWRGSGLSGRAYVHAIAGAKVSLGLLSKGNRDLHTQRSTEIPFAGGLLCAQRTTEHEALYIDGEEAVFWNDAEQCAARCLELLRDDVLRNRIKAGGKARVLSHQLGNEDMCRRVLSALLATPAQTGLKSLVTAD